MTQETLRRVQRVRHELRRRELQVLRVAPISPNVRSITFGGAAMEGFVSASFDDHVKLFLPAVPGSDEPVRRDYTPRHHDAATNELTIEFDLHARGPAARWAANARPGDAVGIGGPRGSLVIPTDFDWHLLAGDETALPAIARRLEELPADATVFVVALARDAADRRVFRTAARATTHWVTDDTALLATVRALSLPAGEGYAWCAGEAGAMAALRRVLVDEKGMDRHAVRAAAYWKRGLEAHHEHLED